MACQFVLRMFVDHVLVDGQGFVVPLELAVRPGDVIEGLRRPTIPRVLSNDILKYGVRSLILRLSTSC